MFKTSCSFSLVISNQILVN